MSESQAAPDEHLDAVGGASPRTKTAVVRKREAGERALRPAWSASGDGEA